MPNEIMPQITPIEATTEPNDDLIAPTYPRDPATYVRASRAYLGITQQQLADKLLLSGARVVRRWEAGHVLVPGPAIVAIRFLLKESSNK